jgi:hypothetical protein
MDAASVKDRAGATTAFPERLGSEDVIVCCSGGGIRSAAFCLGALQSLQRSDLFRRITTITAVSGGSYIAAAWSLQRALVRNNPGEGRDPESAFALGTPEERHLRQNTRYIAPDAPTTLFGVAALLLGIIVNLITVGVPLLFVSTLLGWALRGAGLLRLGRAATVNQPAWLWLACFGPLIVGTVICWVMYLFAPTRDREILVGRRFRASVDLAHSPDEPPSWPVLAWRKFHRQDLAGRWAAVAWVLARLSIVAVAAFLVAPLVIRYLWQVGSPGSSPDAWSQVVEWFGFGHHGTHPLVTVPAVIGTLAALARTSIGKIRTYEKDLKGSLSNSRASTIGAFLRDHVAPHLGVLVVVLAGALLSWSLIAVGVRTAPYGSTSGSLTADLVVAATALAVWLLVRAFVDINHTSLHRYYRDRLAAAYAGCLDLGDNRAAALSSLGHGGESPVPDLVLCASAADTGTGDLPPGRNAVSFTFTPRDVGLSTSARTCATRRKNTRRFEDAALDFTLFDAVAVSGAALSPLMGRMTTPSKRILFALTNVRLGMWLPSPAWVERMIPSKDDRLVRLRRAWIRLRHQHNVRRLWAEMAGTMHLDGKWLYVTDGGHYDNLGLVEAMRRRPKMVIVLDASGDAQGSFTTLGQAVALARTECGVAITVDPEPIGPGPVLPPGEGETANGEVAQAVVRGSYQDRDDPNTSGTLIYARLGVTPDHPWDVRSYLRAHANFPMTSTIAQLYDDAEFEAYRAVGEKTAADIVEKAAKVDAASSPGVDAAPAGAPNGSGGATLPPLAVTMRPENGASSRSVFKVRRPS